MIEVQGVRCGCSFIRRYISTIANVNLLLHSNVSTTLFLCCCFHIFNGDENGSNKVPAAYETPSGVATTPDSNLARPLLSPTPVGDRSPLSEHTRLQIRRPSSANETVPVSYHRCVMPSPVSPLPLILLLTKSSSAAYLREPHPLVTYYHRGIRLNFQ
ncbi:hypothetical protein KQX54_011737 [Cotesia glomerata]|uniref:Uncharacterized protein n=1 Tax=Cotesia glomerata TaxID=32391 RepID=A0AAV7J499_COTGL|nr:hypothetical protein KQX54_011737 [Cotesia glomerata]